MPSSTTFKIAIAAMFQSGPHGNGAATAQEETPMLEVSSTFQIKLYATTTLIF